MNKDRDDRRKTERKNPRRKKRGKKTKEKYRKDISNRGEKQIRWRREV